MDALQRAWRAVGRGREALWSRQRWRYSNGGSGVENDASAKEGSGGSDVPAAASYAACLAILQSCVQSFEFDVQKRVATVRVARAVRGAAESLLRVSERPELVPNEGLEKQIAGVFADIRRSAIAVALVLRGDQSTETGTRVGSSNALPDRKVQLKCLIELLKAEVIFLNAVFMWLEGLLSKNLPATGGSGHAMADALLVSNQFCSLELANTVHMAFSTNKSLASHGRASTSANVLMQVSQQYQHTSNAWHYSIRTLQKESAVFALRILGKIGSVRPRRLRRFLLFNNLVPGLCSQMEVWEKCLSGENKHDRPLKQNNWLVGADNSNMRAKKPSSRILNLSRSASGILDVVTVDRRLSESAVGVLLSLRASGESSSRSDVNLYMTRKTRNENDLEPDSVARMVVLPLARAVAIMANRWQKGVRPGISSNASDRLQGAKIGHSSFSEILTKAEHSGLSWEFASEGLLACALEEQKLSRFPAAADRRDLKTDNQRDNASPEVVSSSDDAWSNVVAVLAVPFAQDPFGPHLQWFPLLLCRLSHLHALQAVLDRTGLRYALRAISLGCWPPPWRKEPRSRRDPDSVVAWYIALGSQMKGTGLQADHPAMRLSELGVRSACATALCALGDTMRPTVKRWSSDYFGKLIGSNTTHSLHTGIIGSGLHAGFIRSNGRRAGVRVLCIDGGGTRGIATIVALKALRERCGGRPISQLFDMICGTSTGGILAVAIGVLQRPLEEIESMYREFAGEVFASSNAVLRAGRTVIAGGAYSVSPLEKILKAYGKDKGGDVTMREYGCLREILWRGSEKEDTTTHARTRKRSNLVEFNEKTSQNSKASPSSANSLNGSCCRVFVVATTSMPPSAKPVPFLFRNYEYPHINKKCAGSSSRHPGSNTHPPWECLRATTAAPGYFPSFASRGLTYQDGALTANNPTGVAIHEAMRVFPEQPIGVVVSVGTGRFLPSPEAAEAAASSLSASTSVNDAQRGGPSVGLLGTVKNAAASLVDTERVHSLLLDLLGDGALDQQSSGTTTSYIRINPEINEVALDENRPQVLKALQEEFRVYCEENEEGRRSLLAAARALVGENGDHSTEQSEGWNARGLWKGGKMLWKASSRL